MSVLDITIHRSSTVCTSVLWKRERELLDGAYLGRLGVWGLGLLATKGFDSEGITPWEFWCGSCEVLGGVGCGSLRGCVGCWESGWRIDSFSLVLFLCSANNTSNRFLLPWTALRWVKECVYRPKTTTTKTTRNGGIAVIIFSAIHRKIPMPIKKQFGALAESKAAQHLIG